MELRGLLGLHVVDDGDGGGARFGRVRGIQ